MKLKAISCYLQITYFNRGMESANNHSYFGFLQRKRPRTMSRRTTDKGWRSPLHRSFKIHCTASCFDWRSCVCSSNSKRNFYWGTQRFALFCPQKKLPSRWIKVRSPQVEGGDVPARLRRRGFCVTKSISGI